MKRDTRRLLEDTQDPQLELEQAGERDLSAFCKGNSPGPTDFFFPPAQPLGVFLTPDELAQVQDFLTRYGCTPLLRLSINRLARAHGLRFPPGLIGLNPETGEFMGDPAETEGCCPPSAPETSLSPEP